MLARDAADAVTARRLLELELEAQRQFDVQEENWKKAFELERDKVVEAYQEILRMPV